MLSFSSKYCVIHSLKFVHYVLVVIDISMHHDSDCHDSAIMIVFLTIDKLSPIVSSTIDSFEVFVPIDFHFL